MSEHVEVLLMSHSHQILIPEVCYFDQEMSLTGLIWPVEVSLISHSHQILKKKNPEVMLVRKCLIGN